MQEPIDFRALVDRASQRVEHEDQVIVDESARELLVRRALDREAAVYAAMHRESLSERDLENAAVAQLREAIPLCRGGSGGLVEDLATLNSLVGRSPATLRIDAIALEESLKAKIHWIGWS